TGALWCGKCGNKLQGWRTRNKGEFKYWCPTPKSHGGGCGGISILATPAELEVESQVLELLTKPEILAQLRSGVNAAPSEEARRELADDEQQLKELTRMWARKELTLGEYKEARKIIEERIKASPAVVRRPMPRVVRELLAGDVVAGWKKLTPAEKRDVLLTLLPGGYEVATA